VTSTCADKLLGVDEAVEKIDNGQTIATSGFCGAGHPESLSAALERRFIKTGTPMGLTLTYAAGQGDRKDRGLNHLAHEGLLKRVVGGHWGLAPGLGELALSDKIEAYNLPQGVISQLFRDIAAGRPGCITHVGLDTFVDPLNGGGRLNRITHEPLVERVEIGRKTWLWYKAFPIHIALIRGTSADVNGSITCEQEAVRGEILPMAQAAHNSGGLVIAQVKRLRGCVSLPHEVVVPGSLIDHIVIAPPQQHHQTFEEDYNATYCLGLPPQSDRVQGNSSILSGVRRIIAARACDEVKDGTIVNLGIGMPEGIAQIAEERGRLDRFTLTVESGPIGGRPAGGLSFGASAYPEAIIDQPSQFDFYDGGGLDFAALGAAQIDAQGNVNVSSFSGIVAGAGGFINITQNARRVVFCGTFTANGLAVRYDQSGLQIVREGRSAKFTKRVEHLTFNGPVAAAKSQDVTYITERAVFRLCADGIELIEVAPGIDIQSQVVNQMAFTPIIRDVRPMPNHVFETTQER
jgi:propionate CoA-transferase